MIWNIYKTNYMLFVFIHPSAYIYSSLGLHLFILGPTCVHPWAYICSSLGLHVFILGPTFVYPWAYIW